MSLMLNHQEKKSFWKGILGVAKGMIGAAVFWVGLTSLLIGLANLAQVGFWVPCAAGSLMMPAGVLLLAGGVRQARRHLSSEEFDQAVL